MKVLKKICGNLTNMSVLLKLKDLDFEEGYFCGRLKDKNETAKNNFIGIII